MSGERSFGRSVSTQVAERVRRPDIMTGWVWAIALLPSIAAVACLALVVIQSGPLGAPMLALAVVVEGLAAVGAAVKDRHTLEAQGLDRATVGIAWAIIPVVYLAIRGRRFRELYSAYSPLAFHLVVTPFVVVLAVFFADVFVITH